MGNFRQKMDGVDDVDDVEFRVGTLVWAKIPGLPWWPGKVVLPQVAPEYVLKFRQEDRTLIYFYGTKDYAWLLDNNLRVFTDSNEKFAVERPMKAHKKYFEQALREMVRAMANQKKANEAPVH